MPGRERSIPSVTPKDVQPSVSSLSEKQLPKSPLEKLVDSSLSKWDSLSPRTQVKKREVVETAIREYRSVDRGAAASAFITWREGMSHGEGQKPSYLRELLSFMEPVDFDVVGEALQQVNSQKSKTRLVEELTNNTENNEASLAGFSPVVVEKMVDTFVEAGYFGEANGILRPKKLGKHSHMGHNALRDAVRAQDLLGVASEPRAITSTADVEERYREDEEKNKVEEIKVSLNKESVTTLHLKKILLGNKASNVKLLGKMLDTISELPPEKKPDVIVVSGIMQGGFENQQTTRRKSLVDDFRLNSQYESAKVYLDKIRELGASVVYNMSTEDRQIAKEGALEVMGKLREWTGHISYYQQNKLMKDEQFDKIERFYIDVVHPYSMLSGRKLRSGEEVFEHTDGRVQTDEFFLLWEAYEKALRGEEIPQEHKDTLEMRNIPFPGKEFDIKFVDDYDLTTTIKGKKRGETQEITEMGRGNWGLTADTLPQNPIAVTHTVSRQMITAGMDTPNELVTDGSQTLGVGGPDGNWVSSTGTLIDEEKFIKLRGSATAGASPQKRQVATRRLMVRPSVEMHEQTADGRHIITIFNETLMEKSHAVPERRTIVQLTDWQNGSTTARPDLAMKYLHMATEIMKDRPTYFMMDGDIIHGDIYPAHKTENAHMQLISASNQQEFVLKMLERGLEHVSADDMQNLLKVMTTPGNHEWNNGFKDNSNVPNQYLVDFFKNAYRSKGIDPEADRVKGYGTVKTKDGSFLHSWSGVEKDIAGHGVVFKHMLLEKGAKGSGDKAPVFQAKTLFEGLGKYAKDVDMGLFGHWHHPQYGLFGDKLAVVGPAMAGWSGFEMDRGYQAVIGGTLIHLGGGEAPQVEFLSAKTLHEYKITDGNFSDKTLRAEGFKTDREFDPGKHGYAQNRTSKESRMSALQKKLWAMTDEVVWEADSKLG